LISGKTHFNCIPYSYILKHPPFQAYSPDLVVPDTFKRQQAAILLKITAENATSGYTTAGQANKL
jgi:hypothetical protein